MTYTIDRAPHTYDYTIWRGDTFADCIAININDAPANITGDTFQMRVAYPSGGQVQFVQTSAGITFPAVNQVQFTFTKIQTNDWPTNINLPYDLQWSRSNGQTVTLLAGFVTVQADITPTI
jgi:hypothetical protein